MYLAEELSGLVCNRVHLGVCTSAERETLLVVVGCGRQQRSHKRYKLRVQFPHPHMLSGVSSKNRHDPIPPGKNSSE